MRRPLAYLVGAQTALIAASVAAAWALDRPEDWRPASLLWLLGGLTVLSGAFPLEVKGVRASGSFLGIVLTATLLGPAPALVVATLTMVLQWLPARRDPLILLCNLAAFSSFAVAAGALVRLAEARGWTDGELGLAVVVAVVFMVTNLWNFLVVAVDIRVTEDAPIGPSLRDIYAPCLPVEVVSALLTAGLAWGHQRMGVAVVGLFAVVGLMFQYLLHLAFEAMRRGEQLTVRTEELASLQVGLLSTVLRTLSLRDKMTARHSAAVARYARGIARALELPEREQELIHTAALLHDIGKFVFPDSILLSDRKLTDEQYAVVKRHPAAGAELVRSIEGYGPVADIVLAHHERIDGRGYPNSLTGPDIPLGARIIAVCDTFDVMTARDSYRSPVSRADAIAELRRVAGAQLDADLVETFIALVERDGVAFRHTDDTDFERELDLPRRVRDHARPRRAAAA